MEMFPDLLDRITRKGPLSACIKHSTLEVFDWLRDVQRSGIRFNRDNNHLVFLAYDLDNYEILDRLFELGLRSQLLHSGMSLPETTHVVLKHTSDDVGYYDYDKTDMDLIVDQKWRELFARGRFFVAIQHIMRTEGYVAAFELAEQSEEYRVHKSYMICAVDTGNVDALKLGRSRGWKSQLEIADDFINMPMPVFRYMLTDQEVQKSCRANLQKVVKNLVLDGEWDKAKLMVETFNLKMPDLQDIVTHVMFDRKIAKIVKEAGIKPPNTWYQWAIRQSYYEIVDDLLAQKIEVPENILYHVAQSGSRRLFRRLVDLDTGKDREMAGIAERAALEGNWKLLEIMWESGWSLNYDHLIDISTRRSNFQTIEVLKHLRSQRCF